VLDSVFSAATATATATVSEPTTARMMVHWVTDPSACRPIVAAALARFTEPDPMPVCYTLSADPGGRFMTVGAEHRLARSREGVLRARGGVNACGAWLIGLLAVAMVGCGGDQRQVVLYTSLDQRLSEPILRDYEKRSGVRVNVLYDTEATKTAGLVNRLLAEQAQPRADVFWNSEIVRTIVLERAGVLERYHSPAAADILPAFKDPDGYWTGFAGRVRVLGINPQRLAGEEGPVSFGEMVRPQWRDRFAIAYPMFGTTSFHVAALFALHGETAAREWLTALAGNGPRVVNGNSTARDLMVAGEVPVCFTDSDDVAVALDRGERVTMIVPRVDDRAILLIPNTVALVAGGPHPEEGKALIDYLLSPEVENKLARAPGAQIPLRPGQVWPEAVPRIDLAEAGALDYDSVADHLQEALDFCKELFVR
jgi:iron(III) transport system substrate-binding protein